MRNSDGVRQERSNWRDEWISDRHRQWGFDCPMVDVDFLAVEYDMKIPVALVDYKARAASTLDVSSASYQALSWLSNMGGFPFMIVFYDATTAVFTVLPVNQRAKAKYQMLQVMSEQEYVTSLYERIRGKSIPQQLLARLSAVKPVRRR